MLFEIEESPKITKEFLLSKNSQETYMQTYTNQSIKKGLVCSCLRKDNRPTCSFFKTKDGVLHYHDFATGTSPDFIKVVQIMYNLNYFQALRKIAEDFGYVERTLNLPSVKPKVTCEILEEKEDVSIQIEKKEYSEEELKWWSSFGISKKTLELYNVYSCKNVFLRNNYFTSSSVSSYIFGYYGGCKKGLELWRIYFPQKKSFRFLSNWSKHILQGTKQLPINGDLLIVTKSQKDIMLLYEFNIPAIAPTSEVLFMTNQQLNRYKSRFKKIVVWYDQDKPGKYNLAQIRHKHPELIYFVIPKEYKAKDISDFYKLYGKDKTKEFINYYLNKLKCSYI